jgi:hypothetical protein
LLLGFVNISVSCGVWASEPYLLPVAGGTTWGVTNGNNINTHTLKEEFAIDFTGGGQIVAAKSGEVTRVTDSYSAGSFGNDNCTPSSSPPNYINLKMRIIKPICIST